jgi:hypothetical protein
MNLQAFYDFEILTYTLKGAFESFFEILAPEEPDFNGSIKINSFFAFDCLFPFSFAMHDQLIDIFSVEENESFDEDDVMYSSEYCDLVFLKTILYFCLFFQVNFRYLKKWFIVFDLPQWLLHLRFYILNFLKIFFSLVIHTQKKFL